MNEYELALWLRAFERMIREAYDDGAEAIATPLDAMSYVDGLDDAFDAYLAVRVALGKKAVERYLSMVRDFAANLAQMGVAEHAFTQTVDAYARTLADQRADLIVTTELGTAKFQGAKDLLTAAGIEAESWDFHHLLTGSDGHVRCEVCEDIEDNAPYTDEEAASLGFPDLPHADCDCGWILRVKQEEPELEEVAA